MPKGTLRTSHKRRGNEAWRGMCGGTASTQRQNTRQDAAPSLAGVEPTTWGCDVRGWLLHRCTWEALSYGGGLGLARAQSTGNVGPADSPASSQRAEKSAQPSASRSLSPGGHMVPARACGRRVWGANSLTPQEDNARRCGGERICSSSGTLQRSDLYSETL